VTSLAHRGTVAALSTVTSALLLAIAGLLILTPALARAAFDQQAEARNYSKINERAVHEHMKPDYRVLLTQQAADDTVERVEIRLNDPERDFSGNLCAHHKDGCAGDVRLYRWAESGYGITRPVLYIGRSGAIISGHVWATRAGPPKRPAVVITTGSVQAPEELYLFAATTLAKKGYVVMTFDVQGQGRSDTFGEEPDRNENFPAQQSQNFIDGTEDALRFLLSSPSRRYIPLPSRTTGTVHRARQQRRVAEGRNAPYNPLHALVDPSRIGIVGHSLGAYAVSAVCCADDAGKPADKRVDAVVAWDNLQIGGTDERPRIIPRVPALGMSADYGLTPTPYTSLPSSQSKNTASNAYSAAGVDTAQLNIRGGTHYEFSYIPNPAFGATLRGMDMVAWYTAAWLDKYVKRDPAADRRLLTRRWRHDARSAEIDPDGDANMFSRYFRSRLDIGLADGRRVRCGNLRDLRNTKPGDNCGAAWVKSDGRPPNYSYLAEAQTPDR
jgi:dienelactone hydrolase